MNPHIVKDKEKERDTIWKLWKECFGDSDAYMTFYFKDIYSHNQVYMLENKGMLHLNPYSVCIHKENYVLPYIVGVATNKEYRRMGVMRQILLRSFTDMYKSNVPFTYLMPADVAYYEPFSFISVSEKREEKVNIRDICMKGKEDVSSRTRSFLSYEELVAEERLYQKTLEDIEKLLLKRYAIYAKHDKEYFKLLYREKACQGGNIIFAYNENECIGCFAYLQYEAVIYIEQYVCETTVDKLLTYFATMDKQIHIVHAFPYMIRVVNAFSFMEIFKNSFMSFAVENKGICLTDSDILENNGYYHFDIKDNQVVVTKESSIQTEGNGKKPKVEYLHWDMKKLEKYIFTEDNCLSNRVFFAEVV